MSRWFSGLVGWTHWNALLSRAPLVMLPLAASYGVYRFAVLFVPWGVALIQAAAFELIYIGLAVSRLPAGQRRRAQYISVGAVAVSVAYNTLDALFHRRPELLASPELWADIGLALLHGAPLAVLAYLVSDLLLHSQPISVSSEGTPATPAAPANGGGRPLLYTLEGLLLALDGEERFTRELALRRLGCSEATLDRLLAEGVQAEVLDRVDRGVYRVRG